jgi:UDP-2,4-diacetamido-2,4,6-trideoxy-beta-L-altropyranose hydrolase
MTETIHQPLIIRADASAQIGTGHVMRCLALAQAWQDAGGRVVFLMAMESPPLEARLRSEGMEVVHLPVQPGSTDDAIQTAALARQVGAGWVVVDGYHFDAGYQRAIKDQGLHLLLVDDIGHAEHYYADLVLNQNIHADEGLYKNREPYTRLLLGTRYVLLRREFLKWRGRKLDIPDVARKVLVTMGGSDPDNVTLKVIQALQQADVDGLEAIVVVGGSNPYYEGLESAVQDSRFPIRLESDVTNMPELMAWADVAVSAGGSTSWELAFTGVPTLVVILASNQRPIAECLDAVGVAVNLGRFEDVSSAKIAQVVMELLTAPTRRAQMSQHGRQLVDGEGTARVLMCLRGEKLRLRPARQDDCKFLWEWANDSDVREVSFSSELISWEEHLQWFKSKLGDRNCLFFIAVDSADVPIGQVRFDIVKEKKEAVISVSIDRKFRGKGYGSAIIQLASQMLFSLSGVNVIQAYIKQNNAASIRAFMKAGYRESGVTLISGHQAVHLLLQKEGGNR